MENVSQKKNLARLRYETRLSTGFWQNIFLVHPIITKKVIHNPKTELNEILNPDQPYQRVSVLHRYPLLILKEKKTATLLFGVTVPLLAIHVLTYSFPLPKQDLSIMKYTTSQLETFLFFAPDKKFYMSDIFALPLATPSFLNIVT